MEKTKKRGLSLKKKDGTGAVAKVKKPAKKRSRFNLVKYIRETIAELKKVSWPTRAELLNYTGVVLLFMVIFAIIIGLLDMGASALLRLLMR